MTETIGISIKRVHNALQRYADREAKKMGLTQTQMSIIDFVFRNEGQREVFQNDVEREFNIQKSTATSLLKLMEKKNLIIRIVSTADSRYKTILLTDKSRGLANRIDEYFKKNDQELRKVLGADATNFFANLSKLQTYLEDELAKEQRQIDF